MKINIEEKTKKLKYFAQSVLDNPNNNNELNILISKLGLTKEEIIDSYVKYDLDIFAYGNEIYDPIAMRLVLHLHNMLPESWHIERQNTINQFIQDSKPSSIMDIGFGIPSFYIKKALKKKTFKIELSDLCESALGFARMLLDIWDNNWQNVVEMTCQDMNETSLKPPKHDIYIFQDSIEHVADPTNCLKQFVKNSHLDAKFLLSLPVGPITPIHYIAWDSTSEITNWLRDCGLKIISSRTISVNPKVDLFAEQLNFNYDNFVVLCSKY